MRRREQLARQTRLVGILYTARFIDIDFRHPRLSRRFEEDRCAISHQIRKNGALRTRCKTNVGSRVRKELAGEKKYSRSIRISAINRGPWEVSRRLTEKFARDTTRTLFSNSMDKLARTRRLDFRCSWTDLGRPIADSSSRIRAKLGQPIIPFPFPSLALFDPTFPKLYPTWTHPSIRPSIRPSIHPRPTRVQLSTSSARSETKFHKYSQSWNKKDVIGNSVSLREMFE